MIEILFNEEEKKMYRKNKRLMVLGAIGIVVNLFAGALGLALYLKSGISATNFSITEIIAIIGYLGSSKLFFDSEFNLQFGIKYQGSTATGIENYFIRDDDSRSLCKELDKEIAATNESQENNEIIRISKQKLEDIAVEETKVIENDRQFDSVIESPKMLSKALKTPNHK